MKYKVKFDSESFSSASQSPAVGRRRASFRASPVPPYSIHEKRPSLKSGLPEPGSMPRAGSGSGSSAGAASAEGKGPGAAVVHITFSGMSTNTSTNDGTRVGTSSSPQTMQQQQHAHPEIEASTEKETQTDMAEGFLTEIFDVDELELTHARVDKWVNGRARENNWCQMQLT